LVEIGRHERPGCGCGCGCQLNRGRRWPYTG
jgi:hypothetical protein